MEKIFVLAVALAISLGTTTILASHRVVAGENQKTDAELATDGAFRDGLYIGRIAAKTGQPLRPPIGRWSNEHDRTSFAAGYSRGYNDVLASSAHANQNATE